jgi:Ca-activated chloride channel family protein
MNRLPELLFDTPWAVVFGALLPLVVFGMLAWRDRQRRARLLRYGDQSATSRLLGGVRFGNPWRTVRLLVVTLLLGLAMAGPRWGLARGATSGRGIDIAIALDASLSMTATDERPSRLERMKQEVRRLRAMSRADRVALIAFAGRSYILTPLTSDDGALELFLDNLDPTVVGQAGSSLSRAIRQGTELLLSSDGSADRALIVMSDGETFEPLEDVVSAAKDAGTKGISLVTVGFGTEKGATIPIRDGTVIREKRDDQGKVVITKYDPKTLAAAASAADGSFVPADVSDKAARIRSALRFLRTARRSVDSREDHVARFAWLVVPALLLLLLDSLIAERGMRALLTTRRTPKASPPDTIPTRTSGVVADVKPKAPSAAASTYAPRGAQLLVLCALLGPLALASCAKPPDAAALLADGKIMDAISVLRKQLAAGDSTFETKYNLGSALLAADSTPVATELLEDVRRGAAGEVRMRSRFNAGLSELKQGREPGNPKSDEQLGAAVAAYKAYLLDQPDDVDAKWNYELALRKPPPPQGGGGGSNNSQPESPQGAKPKPTPGALDPKQAEALLNSAAREERDVQGRKQKQGRTPPPGGKDW